MADSASAAGLSVSETPDKDRDSIEKLIPAFGSARNPVDVTAQAIASGVGNYQEILRTMLDSEGFDAVVVGSGMRGDVAVEVSTMIAEMAHTLTTPLAVTWFSTNDTAKAIMVDAGVPVFSDGSRSVGAIGALHRFRDIRGIVGRPVREPGDPNRADSARRIIAQAASDSVLLESESKALLALYGLPVTREHRVSSPAQAAAACADFGDNRVALKILSPDLPHKSDVGGVALHLDGASAVHAAAEKMLRTVTAAAPTAHIEGLLVQEMAEPGIEFMCGLHQDPIFGPVVAVGLGGVLVEVVGEVALRCVPLTFDHARDAITQLVGGRLASHSRGINHSQMDAVAEVMVTLGRIAIELPEIDQIDINPLVVSPSGQQVVDALVIVRAPR